MTNGHGSRSASGSARCSRSSSTRAELAELRKSVEAGSGWFDLKTQEGTVALNLATVVFIRVDDASHAIGFAG